MNLHWDKEELEDEITKALIASWETSDVLERELGREACPLTKPDFGAFRRMGPYLSPHDRVTQTDEIDTINDFLPQKACIGFVATGEDTYFTGVYIERLKRFPGGVSPRSLGIPFAHDVYRFCNTGGHFGARIHCTMNRHGGVDLTEPLYSRQARLDAESRKEGEGYHRIIPAAITLWCDRRYLWNVKVAGDHDARASFGVYPEQVTSLFRAREEPVTGTGRLRPILHWVRQHRRRLRDGDTSDVTKHLRGIESFEMDGFGFTITQPTKKQK